MLFKKNKKPIITFQDKKIQELAEDRLRALNTLVERTEKVITCNGVIDLYPEGADKEKAKKDAEEAKFSLLCAIGIFDDLTNRYLEALAEPYERVTTLDYTSKCKTSHEIIEMAYRNFYKK